MATLEKDSGPQTPAITRERQPPAQKPRAKVRSACPMGCSCRTFVEEQSLLFSVRLALKATGILDGFVCRQLDGA
jgi:hypothetical protein